MTKPRGYWNKDKCFEESIKYNTRTEFQIKNPSAYISSRKNGWLNDICYHMIEKIKPPGFWTKNKCLEESSRYKTRSEFNKFSSKAYQHAWQNGWLDEICSHMQLFGDKYKRCIYAYEFSDNSAYVGLTFNINIRHSNHISNMKSPVYNKINQNLKYKFKKLSIYLDIDKAKELEKYYVDEYKKNKWLILNKAKTGGTGGKLIKWTKEKCEEESLKYETKSEIKKYNGTVYNVIMKKNWTYMFNHMIQYQKPTGYWTKERCQEEALKFNNKKDFKKYSKAYSPSCKKGWLNEICIHMK
jgi:hypothetical protein